ncbi:hypothetical protein [Saccharothrix syringae]|uniref:hypothetical protein n=1 Tax=Saccharothrix syringae TaxID=103733 RepID=UPI000A68711F|nr:hypothetical protein [Saccharothrix syringae]
MRKENNAKSVVANEFPEVAVSVAPITQRSRATLAKTHNRPAVANFADIFNGK